MPEQRPQSPGRPTPARRWKRRVILALLLLCGGAVVNVAVAWGLPTFTRDWRTKVVALNMQSIAEGVRQFVNRSVESDFGHLQSASEDRRQVTQRGRWFVLQREDPSLGGEAVLQTGWPLLALSGPIDHPYASKGLTELVNSIVAMRPILPGFIINTLFYALLLWLLFIAPFTTRRIIRRRRGQCERCAYPIGTSEVCTECGAAVARRQAT